MAVRVPAWMRERDKARGCMAPMLKAMHELEDAATERMRVVMEGGTGDLAYKKLRKAYFQLEAMIRDSCCTPKRRH